MPQSERDSFYGELPDRVVIYRDGADKATRVLPYTLGDSADPEDLWKALAAYEEKTGGQVVQGFGRVDMVVPEKRAAGIEGRPGRLEGLRKLSLPRHLHDLLREFGCLDQPLPLCPGAAGPRQNRGGAGHAIQPYDASECDWIDIGTPAKLQEASRMVGM